MGLAALLAACGGGGGGSSPPATVTPDGCDVASRNTWLRSYMDDWYYWSGSAPRPDPLGYTSVEGYFDASLYAGDTALPADRWSYISDSAQYNQFFGAGMTLGYGVSVNGLEGTLPLKIRYVDPLSPAADAGLQRGDVIVSLNGRSASDIVADGDFSVLSPAQAGDVLDLVVQDASGTRSVRLTARSYALVPVSAARVFTLPSGSSAGYLVLKDFVTQAEPQLSNAFAQFRAAGATELILDLRYNGGGRVSTATLLASLVGGASNNGKVFTRLLYNAQHASANSVFALAGGSGAAFNRVVVLTGPRTCSASELVVNGLKPYVPVVTIGGTTCGKPFGFSPVESCGSTYSAVNFETVNVLGEGRYFNGIAPNCAVNDDFSGQLGDETEKLTAAAQSYLQTGVCPVTQATAATKQPSRVVREPGMVGLRGD